MSSPSLSPNDSQMKRDSRRRWLSGLAVTLTTIVAYLAFWRLSPVVTFVVGCFALVGVVIAGWIYGKDDNPTQPPEK